MTEEKEEEEEEEEEFEFEFEFESSWTSTPPLNAPPALPPGRG